MKNLLFKTIFVLAVLVVGFSVISCSDDEKDDPVTPAPDMTVKDVTVSYSVSLAQSYYDFFVIKLEYVDETNQIINKEITANWEYSFTKSYAETPENIVCKVFATPKDPLPSIEEEEYDRNASVWARVDGYTKDGVENPKFGCIGKFNVIGSVSTKDWERYTSINHTLLDLEEPKGPANPKE